jgi:hypothetical protein
MSKSPLLSREVKDILPSTFVIRTAKGVEGGDGIGVGVGLTAETRFGEVCGSKNTRNPMP